MIDDNDTKTELPFHIVLGASNFSKIKTNMPARIEKTVEPVADLIKFLWMIISPDQEDYSKAYMTQSITHDYEQLYRLDVLGLVDTSDGDQNIVYTEFKNIFSGVHKDDTRLGCHENQTTLSCTQPEWKPCPFI